ncbi:MAG: type II toxin-antitoxin system RelB/DinJ family antitoxin [Clostridiales Family XIII bacterium]|jgi:DNA-damage-inducible protein J|nr:type II toxin-antitoxin system RelB/DinJ family antitoxin [Clostridiales Family XIII bacterium]
MPETTNLNIRIDRDLKTRADKLFNAMGMNLTTAVNVFVRQAVQEQAIPFRIQWQAEDKEQFNQLIDEIRDETAAKGFLGDEEIDAEIQAYRAERKAKGTAV